MIEPLLRPFQDADADAIANRDGEECTADQIRHQAAQGVAFTAELNGEVIGCAGVMLPWAGVGHAWMLLSSGIEGHEFWMYKMVRLMLKDIIIKYKLHRLESVALADSPRNQRWQEALGFTKEQDGIAQQMLPDKRSMIRYEQLIGEEC